jgi:serine/threonine-protein kinase
LPKSAVVKVLGMMWTDQPGERAVAAARFLREAAIVQRLSHPHILRVLAVGLVQGMPYVVTPYLPGGTLASALRHGPLPLPETARFLAEIAAALDYAHSQGIVHGDVQPAHVLLDDSGASYLGDFGMARLVHPASGAAWAGGVIIGTPPYMAPEHAQGAVVGPAADIFSLSVLLYQVVTGVLPFTGRLPVDILLSVLRDAPTSPRTLRPDLPAPAEAALLQGLAKQPEDRFASAGELADAFARGLDGQPESG